MVPLSDDATPRGPRKPERDAAPPSPDHAPDPASVTTVPSSETPRRRFVPVSATINAPGFTLVSHAKCDGDQKDALRPTPSANAGSPLPARVRTIPPAMSSTLSAWLPPSAMYRNAPVTGVIARPVGPEKRAWFEMRPSAKPAPSCPATVDVAAGSENPGPAGTSERMRLEPESLTYSTPVTGCSASANGDWKLADAPTPSVEPATPNAPAMVATTPPALRTRTDGAAESATKSDTPSAAQQKPAGQECCDVPSAPSAPPADVCPDTVDTAAAAGSETRRTRPPMASATKREAPSGDVTNPHGS